jgi:hypothetical protein
LTYKNEKRKMKNYSNDKNRSVNESNEINSISELVKILRNGYFTTVIGMFFTGVYTEMIAESRSDKVRVELGRSTLTFYVGSDRLLLPVSEIGDMEINDDENSIQLKSKSVTITIT